MTSVGHFHVQGRLVEVLAGQWRSSEEALKELVANSWDADATRVEIELPLAFSARPIVVRDNGCGMTSPELRSHYLGVAIDRRQIWGTTTQRGRRVRGHLGIGRFAGFLAADCLTVTTVARGERSSLVLDKKYLQSEDEDLEQVDLPIEIESCTDSPGTTVELSLLRPGLEQPSPSKLGALLLREFGVKDDFQIFIEGSRLTLDVLEGKKAQFELPLEDDAQAEVAVWLISKERAVADPGIVLRVDGRAVGPPSYFGLDDDPDIPRHALKRLSGEVQANHLLDHVTANWSGVIENSGPYQKLQEQLREVIKPQLLAFIEEESPESEQQFIDRYTQQLELLPFSRRDRARQALLRLFKRLFRETPDRRHVVADVVINVFEEDQYWLIARRLDEIQPGDLVKLASVLRDWGLGHVADIASRAKERLEFLDRFEELATAKETLELQGVHRVLEISTWLFGDEYELWVSNRSLRRIVSDYTGRVFRGANASKRPDLILIGLGDKCLIVELKRPSLEISQADVAQAKTYRDGLRKEFPNKKFRLLVLGGTAQPQMAREEGPTVRVSTYRELVEAARQRLQWLLDNVDPEVTGTQGPSQDRLRI